MMAIKRKVHFGKKPARPPRKPALRPVQVSRAARLLALAYYVERLVERGHIKDYAEAARQLGVTRARMTQVMGMLNLAVPIQGGLLTGEIQVSERRIRRTVAQVEWERQKC